MEKKRNRFRFVFKNTHREVYFVFNIVGKNISVKIQTYTKRNLNNLLRLAMNIIKMRDHQQWSY
jgi:hypothetical protein